MARTLLVKAHPLTRTTSYSFRALEEITSRYLAAHPEAKLEELDLFDGSVPELDRELLLALERSKKGEPLTPSQADKLARYQFFTEQFLAADHIILFNPLWNLNVPSQLVSWLNTLHVSGVTFKYGENGAVGLVKGKKVLHVQLSGGVYGGKDPAAQYVRSAFEFLGIEDVRQLFIEGQAAYPDKAQEIFEASMIDLDRLLENF